MNKGIDLDVQATLDVWRCSGAHNVDPVRFHFIQALSDRAAALEGEARRVLDDRLAALLQAFQRDVDATTALPAESASASDGLLEPSGGPLLALMQHIASHAPRAASGRTPQHGALPRETCPEPPFMDYFRQVWAGTNTRRQLRHALEQVPDNAGPLNSSVLVHRMLSLMRDTAPDYLDHFIAYVDALAWMEQLAGDDLAPSHGTGRRDGTGSKPARGA